MTVASQDEQNPAYRPTPFSFSQADLCRICGGGRWDERAFRTCGLSNCDLAQKIAGKKAKKPVHSNTLGSFLRKGWKYCHTIAFLLDSQAKIP